MAYWLLVRTRAGALEGHSSTRRPTVQRGDLAVCYLAGSKSIFAVAEVVSDPENDPGRTRWQWRFAIRPVLAVEPREGPPVEAAGVLPRSLGRHSYVRLTAEQFEAGGAAIARAVVEAGYDAMADRFAAWQREIVGSPHGRYLDELVSLLPDDPRILDLGCGAGTVLPGRLTGVDISAEQLRRAREHLPDARLIQADVAGVDFPPDSFDAVTALYLLNHLPPVDLRRLPGRVFRWLRPGGHFLASFASSDPGQSPVPNWLGVPMYFASLGVEGNRRVLQDAGFQLLRDEVVVQHEPDGEASFEWVLAKKPA